MASNTNPCTEVFESCTAISSVEFGNFNNNYEILLSEKIPDEEQPLLNLSRRLSNINELPPTINSISNVNEFATPIISDISMATRRNLLSTDDNR